MWQLCVHVVARWGVSSQHNQVHPTTIITDTQQQNGGLPYPTGAATPYPPNPTDFAPYPPGD